LYELLVRSLLVILQTDNYLMKEALFAVFKLNCNYANSTKLY